MQNDCTLMHSWCCGAQLENTTNINRKSCRVHINQYRKRYDYFYTMNRTDM